MAGAEPRYVKERRARWIERWRKEAPLRREWAERDRQLEEEVRARWAREAPTPEERAAARAEARRTTVAEHQALLGFPAALAPDLERLEARDATQDAAALAALAATRAPMARFARAVLLDGGVGGPRDPATAVALLEELGAEKHPLGIPADQTLLQAETLDYNFGEGRSDYAFEQETDGRFQPRPFQAFPPGLGPTPRLVQVLERQADRGNARAQLLLGKLKIAGLGVAQDLDGGYRWVKRASAKGALAATYFLVNSFSDYSCYDMFPWDSARGRAYRKRLKKQRRRARRRLEEG